MNKSSSGNLPKNKISPPIKFLFFNISKIQSTSFTQKYGYSCILNPSQSNKYNVKIASTSRDKIVRLSNSSINHSASNFSSINPHLTTHFRFIDNTPVSDAIITQLTYTNDSQSLIEHLIKPIFIYTNTNTNFSAMTTTENTPSRKQTIVFNSIDEIY